MSMGMVIVEMKRHFQLRAIEWWSAGLMASWGFYSLLRPGMFGLNPATAALLGFAPQHVWGLCALIVGGFRLLALTINGFWYRTPSIRWLTSTTSVLVWFCVTASLTKSPTPYPGVVVYGWLVLADIYSAFRSASDYVEAEAQRKVTQIGLAQFSEGGDNVRSINRR